MSDRPLRRPSIQLLKQFRYLDDLDDEQLELLGKSLQVRHVRKKTVLFRRGAREDFSLFLLEGELLLEDEQGQRHRVAHGNELASGPISPDLPRKYTALCLTDVAYLELDNRLLEELQANARTGEPPGYLPVGDQGGDPLTELIGTIRSDLEGDRLVMPTLPEVALRVGRAINDDSSDAHDVAAIVQTDPAITAKLIRVANNAFYASPNPASSCAEAVMRLGFKTTYKLVLGFALREVFRTRSPLLEARMRELWQHSVKVAAVCFVLAKMSRRFDPEHALLCGLVHDIGVVSLISYSARYPAIMRDQRLFDQVVDGFRGDISMQILDRWKFPYDLVSCAGNAEDWLRDTGEPADYCDLLITAQVYSYLGTPREAELPPITDLPGFRKLELPDLVPDASTDFLAPIREQLVLAESMIGV